MARVVVFLKKDFLSKSFIIFGLGALNFIEKAFAEKNFYCDFYEDGDDLENNLHFRQHTLEDYFEIEKAKISPLKKTATSIFKTPVKWYLLKQSEPYEAIKNKELQALFFNLTGLKRFIYT